MAVTIIWSITDARKVITVTVMIIGNIDEEFTILVTFVTVELG